MTAPMTDALIEDACIVMHDAYEEAAQTTGWQTQQASRTTWGGVPEANKETMRAAVRALMEWLADGAALAARPEPIGYVRLDRNGTLDYDGFIFSKPPRIGRGQQVLALVPVEATP